MHDDEAQIRQLIATWMAATKVGDAETVLGLMADDVVFLVPGRPPFGKAAFAEAAKAQSDASVQFDGSSEVLEVRVFGDLAFTLTRLSVTAKTGNDPPTTRAGHTLSILARHDGKWQLARDANLLAPVAGNDA
ncbi:MAG TPA: nuclear transport factor 2 family protein [Lysobacter sp.]